MEKKVRIMTSVYLKRKDEILFLYRIGSSTVPNSYVASAGGHMESEEINDPHHCVLRELFEETGLTEEDIIDLKLRYITLRNIKQEIRQIYYYFAELKNSNITINSNEGILEWVNIKDALSLDMPLTAKQVIEHYITEGKNTDILYGSFIKAGELRFIPFLES